MKPFTTIAAIMLGIVALAHLYRVFQPFEVTVSGNAIPQWVSIAGFLVAGVLSAMLWREGRRAA
jgi:protein-S-isoprenylcysteine O-methyltransferase Ste14